MSKGKGGGKQSSTTTTVQALPEYARPYFERMMGRAETESQEGYTQYPGQRLAGFTPDQSTLFQGARDLYGAGTPGQMGLATNFATQAGGYSPTYNPMTFQGGTFGTAEAQQYMDPYIQSVLNVQKGRMTRDFNEQQAGRDAAAVKAGAFGGNRRFVADEVARRGLNEQMQAVDAQGMSQAYNTAAGLFEADRNARLGAERMTDQSNQFGAQLGLAGAGQQLQAAGMLGGLGQADQQLAMQRLGLLGQTGAQQQGQTQAGLDIGYQDFLAQQGWDQNQINFLSSILRGVPVSPSSTMTASQPNPSLLSQLGGLGLGAFGLSRMV